MARVLTVDVGNTFTNLGLFEGDQLLGSYEATTPERCTADEAAEVARRALRSIAPNSPAAAAGILACVVPALTDVWTRALGAVCGARALVVGPGLKSGLKMRYDDPAEVGADRVADAVAAREIFGAPCVVVNLGTTTNFEVLDASGAFAGGIIAPGVELGAESIAVAAARLPKIELRTPARVIGRCSGRVGGRPGGRCDRRRPHRGDGHQRPRYGSAPQARGAGAADAHARGVEPDLPAQPEVDGTSECKGSRAALELPRSEALNGLDIF